MHGLHQPQNDHTACIWRCTTPFPKQLLEVLTPSQQQAARLLAAEYAAQYGVNPH